MTPRVFSIVRFVLQHLLGERPIEELDEGPKAERTDQGAKANKATQQPAQQGAERIGEDAAPEVRAGCVVPQTEGKVIVGRNAEVGGLVERSAQRRDQHRRDDPRQLHRQRRRVAEVGVNGVIERRDDVPDADTVDEDAKADVLAPEPEFQQCFFSPIIRLLWAGDKLFMERYNDIRGLPYPFNLASIRSFSSPSPITMSTSCPLGIAFAVRPSAVAFSSTQPFSSCTKPFARSTWPHAGSVKRAGIFCSSCWHERPSSKK